ncbi:VOC family protein [Glycomyces arizonensis]|uniref:VOC family protein n=1 Tax=Glycomyces arizonensis TaxID=256035 RepID=UPI000403B38F|nr:VOC family protein [Glycomyces arizonensis]
MAARIDLTFDCADAVRLGEFWKLALGYVDEPPPPPFKTRQEWLRHHGVTEDDPSEGTWLCDPEGIGPRLSILRVPEPKTAKNRLHIDIRVGGKGDDRWERIAAEAERLKAAGATVIDEAEGHHMVMADPEGNEFCVA